LEFWTKEGKERIMAVIGSRRDESYNGPVVTANIQRELSQFGTCFFCQSALLPEEALIYWCGTGVLVPDLVELGPNPEVLPTGLHIREGVIILHPWCVMDWFARLAQDVQEIAEKEP
jgi:hypothetical protein